MSLDIVADAASLNSAIYIFRKKIKFEIVRPFCIIGLVLGLLVLFIDKISLFVDPVMNRNVHTFNLGGEETFTKLKLIKNLRQTVHYYN